MCLCYQKLEICSSLAKSASLVPWPLSHWFLIGSLTAYSQSGASIAREASLTHGLSCTEWPLSHRSASLTQISLSRTDRILSHVISAREAVCERGCVQERPCSLAHSLFCTDHMTNKRGQSSERG